MGIRLMVEVLDHWQDAGLTAGERNDLLVLAENANDRTRLTFGPVHEPYILRRAGKTAEGWKNAVGKLLRKKVLTVDTPGRIKQAAVYRLEPLCPEVRHDGYKGVCTRPSKGEREAERVTPQVTHTQEEGHLSDDPMGHPTGDPLGQEGHLTGGKRVTSQVTPTPLNPSLTTPSVTPSSSLAEPVETVPAAEPDVTEGGGGGSDLRSIAEHITAHLDYRGKPPDRRQRKTIHDRLVAALEAGWTMRGLALYLDLGEARVDSPAAIYAHRLHPDRLPDPEPLPAPPRASGGVRGDLPTAAEIEALTVEDFFGTSWRDTADGVDWPAESARARQRLAATPKPSGHQPFQCPPASAYSHGFGTEPAAPAEAATTPWCGEPDCDPITRFRDADAGNGLKVSVRCDKCHPKMQR